MDNQIRWDQIRYFLAVAQAGSAVAAAQQLGVSHATVMRNIAQLEARLGVRLFDHVRTGYRITDDGADMLTSARAMEAHADALLRQAMGRNPSPAGRLKLALADTSLFDSMLSLREFRRAHPRIELHVEDGQASATTRLMQLHVDAAILVTNAPPETLVGRQISRVNLRWLASAEQRDRGGEPSDPAPEECEWIVWTAGDSTEASDAWQRAQLRRLTPRPRVVLQVEKHSDALAAVRAGIGAALLSDAYSDELRRLPFAARREAIGVWLLTHPDLRRAGRVRALFDFIASQQRSSR
jgi:DNA-binding transcriptional LysR family regulator